jgi:hypothetical protein
MISVNIMMIMVYYSYVPQQQLFCITYTVLCTLYPVDTYRKIKILHKMKYNKNRVKNVITDLLHLICIITYLHMSHMHKLCRSSVFKFYMTCQTWRRDHYSHGNRVKIYNRIRHINKVHFKSQVKWRANVQSHSQIGLPIFPVVTDFSSCKEYAANIISQIWALEMLLASTVSLVIQLIFLSNSYFQYS